MAKSKLVKVNEKIAEKVVGGYKKIENGAVGGFNKIANKFVDNYLTKEGESVEEARERLSAEQKQREAVSVSESEKRTQNQAEILERSMQSTQQAVLNARKVAGLS